jgi:sugar/nucleoside kinase (ribokinase family)
VASKDEPILQALRREGLRVRIGTTEKTTHFVNYTDADDRRQEVPFTAAPIKYSQIADVLEYVAFLHLGPLYPRDIEADAIERLRGSPFPIGLDIQGYVRQIKDGIVYPAVSEHLAIAFEVSQVVKASLEELNLVLDSYRISLADLMTSFNIEEFIVTMGSKGGFVRRINGEELYYSAKSLAKLVDPTGAGDVFFAAYLFSRFFKAKDLADASKLAANAAGQQVEGKYITTNELGLRLTLPSFPQ